MSEDASTGYPLRQNGFGGSAAESLIVEERATVDTRTETRPVEARATTHDKTIRTCLPATCEEGETPENRAEVLHPEQYIVRGED